jgi:hypothetical protein
MRISPLILSLFLTVPVWTQGPSLVKLRISGVEMMGPRTALVWAETAREFCMWRVDILTPTPQWTRVAVPTPLVTFKSLPSKPYYGPYVTVNVNAGDLRLIWLKHSDCEVKAWDQLRQSGKNSTCRFNLYDAKTRVAPLLAGRDDLAMWTVTGSSLTDGPARVLWTVNQVAMVDEHHGWMLLQGVSQMNRMPEALVTTSDGSHWGMQPANDMPLGNDFPQILLPVSGNEAWFAAVKPAGIWHTTGGGRAWSKDQAVSLQFPWCKDCDVTSIRRIPSTEGPRCLDFQLTRSSTESGQHVRESIGRYCLAKNSREWIGPADFPTAGERNRNSLVSPAVYADSQLGLAAVSVSPQFTSSIYETSDRGATWRVAPLGAAGKDALVGQVSTSGDSVVLLLWSRRDGDTTLMFSPDHGTNWRDLVSRASNIGKSGRIHLRSHKRMSKNNKNLIRNWSGEIR